MAIADIKAYSHLSEEDVAEIGRRFEEIAAEHRAALGPKDARYIRTLIRVQRGLEVAGPISAILLLLTGRAVALEHGRPQVNIKLDGHGGDLMSRATRANSSFR